MTKYLERANWHEGLYQALNILIDEYKTDPQVDKSQRNYVVFDCDDTIIHSDLESELLDYMLENMLIKLDQDEFESIIYSAKIDYNLTIDNFGQAVSGQDLARDLVEAYKSLSGEAEVDRSIRLDFYIKYQFFYEWFWTHFNYQPNSPLAPAFFAGISEGEFHDLVCLFLKDRFNQPITKELVQSPSGKNSYSGQVKIIRRRGLKIFPEMKNLINTLVKHGIEVYIVSGSIEELVRIMAVKCFDLKEDNIFGTRYSQDDQTRYLAQFTSGYPVCLNQGKVQVIKDYIAPIHQNRAPIAVFGNSEGDYPMLSEFTGTKLSVLINHQLDDLSQTVYQKAKESSNRYFSQGVDLNTGHFIKSQESILCEI